MPGDDGGVPQLARLGALDGGVNGMRGAGPGVAAAESFALPQKGDALSRGRWRRRVEAR